MSGELAAGMRLPSTQELAAQWKTHPNSVQRALTPLAREGLLTRIPRVGTFVRKTDSKLTRVGIYYAGDFWLHKTFSFYGALHAGLQKLLRQSQIELTVWVDPRTAQERGNPWPALLDAARNRAIQALILPDVAHSWLQKIPVPTASFMEGDGICTAVRLDFRQFAELSLQRVVAQGCRSVGMISADPLSNKGTASDATNAAFYEEFAKRATEMGISVRKEWVCRPKHKPSGEDHAGFGYDQFIALWQQRGRPEALVIWPDSVALGGLMAISEIGVSIPQELELILHKNDVTDLFCPFPTCFVVTRVHEVAEALWGQIRKQSEGERCRPILVPFHCEDVTASRLKLNGLPKKCLRVGRHR